MTEVDAVPECPLPPFPLVFDAIEYGWDAAQRSVLFLDVLRRQGNQFFDYLAEGEPPLLSFPYEIIMDGRGFEAPVNYALARIFDRRRDGEEEGRSREKAMRPVVIIDPRSGNAPGIGGIHQNSEIGMALSKGHPVYFILFFPKPVPGQRIEDVAAAEVLFLEEVHRRHPEAGRPSVIGNSQAGWALALMSADTPNKTGPLVLNGSPISYWSGIRGRHVLRYKAGLMGGIWVVNLQADLGCGEFDGANLVAGHEALEPEEYHWARHWRLFRNVEEEETAYLAFSKWWDSYYRMTGEEIRFVVEHLFIGNEVERGEVSFREGRKIDLRDLEDPVLLFSSDGDNITPPQQALNWIVTVWGSLEEVKRQNQVIVYLLHENVGHIGLFVSEQVATREHAELIGSIDMVDFLSPGLYEMIIEPGDASYSENPHRVRYEPRTFEDIRALNTEKEADFLPASEASRNLNHLYETFAGPFIRMVATPFSASLMRMFHPLRQRRILLSDLNPWLSGVGVLADRVREHRCKAPETNRFRMMEENFGEMVHAGITADSRRRDVLEEQLFFQIYENAIFRWEEEEEGRRKDPPKRRRRRQDIRAEDGGTREAMVRVLLAMASVDNVIHQEELSVFVGLVRNHPETKDLDDLALRTLIREQSRVLETDYEKALSTLPILLPEEADRKSVVEIAQCVAMADLDFGDEEKRLLARIMQILKV